MTIGAVIRVKDDIDLVQQNIAYHSSVGVDFFVVFACGSSPKSFATLEELYATRTSVRVLRQDLRQRPDIDRQAMDHIRLQTFQAMTDEFSPDWTFFPDTDEFWVPASGNLKTAVERSRADLLKVGRFNAALPLNERPPVFGEIPDSFELMTDMEIIVNPTKRRPWSLGATSRPSILDPVVPKFITRLKEIKKVEPGFHDLQAPGITRKENARNVLILHLPVTTFDRFLSKTRDIREYMENVGGCLRKRQAHNWKRWAALGTDEAALMAEYETQFFSENDLRLLRDNKAVMKVRDWLGIDSMNDST